MNPKDDQTPQSNKIFDVMRPGKAPANPTSRPFVGSGSNVKDFDFADKPSNSISKFGRTENESDASVDEQKPGAPEIDFSNAPSESHKNMLDLDKDAPDSDLSKIQSELSNSPSSTEPKHSTDFKPDNFETSNTDLDDDTPNTDADDQYLGLDPQDDDLFNESPEEDRAVDNRQNEKSAQSTNERRKTKNQTTKQSDNSKPQKDTDVKNTNIPREDDLTQAQPVTSAATGQMIVSQHARHPHLWAELLAVLVIVALIAGIANLLLDAGLISLEGVPRTDFFSEN